MIYHNNFVNRITYPHNSTFKLLMQDGKLIIYAKKDQNLLIFDLVISSKIKQVNRNANATTILG